MTLLTISLMRGHITGSTVCRAVGIKYMEEVTGMNKKERKNAGKWIMECQGYFKLWLHQSTQYFMSSETS